MENNICKYLEELDLKEHNNKYYGKYKNFQINILQGIFANEIKCIILVYNPYYEDILHDFEEKYSNLKTYSNLNYIKILIKKDEIESITTILDGVIDLLTNKYGIIANNCPICGQILDGETDFYDKEYFYEGHKDCVAYRSEVNYKDIEQEKKPAYKNTRAKSRYILGFLGALLGAIIASGITVLFFWCDLVASLPALFSSTLGYFLYVKFGGRRGIAAGWIVAITTILIQVLTIFLCHYFEPYFELDGHKNGYFTVNEAFRFFCDYASNFVRNIIRDMLLTLLFSTLGSAFIIAQGYREAGNANRYR